VTFFARYEASQMGSPTIEPEHLLLGILREDKALGFRFLSSHAVFEVIREQIVAHTSVREKVSTSVDLPMSADSKRVLAYAAEETPNRQEIGTTNLFLGILRLENCFAAEILHNNGLSLAAVRQELQGAKPSGSVKRAHSKPTACKDCRHLIVDGPIAPMNLFCGASPQEPVFNCYTGELKTEPSAPPSKRYQLCAMVNFGECRLFEQKEG
jgi:ATP-dependent Clp protease ATP-binding subunit ClpA